MQRLRSHLKGHERKESSKTTSSNVTYQRSGHTKVKGVTGCKCHGSRHSRKQSQSKEVIEHKVQRSCLRGNFIHKFEGVNESYHRGQGRKHLYCKETREFKGNTGIKVTEGNSHNLKRSEIRKFKGHVRDQKSKRMQRSLCLKRPHNTRFTLSGCQCHKPTVQS